MKSSTFAKLLLVGLALILQAPCVAQDADSPPREPAESAPGPPGSPGSAGQPQPPEAEPEDDAQEADTDPDAAEPAPVDEANKPPASLPFEEADAPRPGAKPAQPGDDVVIVLTDGQRLEGRYVSRDERGVVIHISGVDLTVESSRIERVFTLDPPLERYRRMRSMIKDEDVERLVSLADWLRRRKLYSESLIEIEQALSVEPQNGDALRLKQIVSALAELQERAITEDDSESEIGEPRRRPSPRVATRPKPAEFPLLTSDQINLLKVYEIDLRNPPRMTVPREVVQRLLADYSDNPLIPETREGRDAFFRKPASEILDVMFRVRARELYGLVIVHDQPSNMKVFRDQVHAAWLVTSCASTACHGGSDSGRLKLFNYRPTAEESVYTNFLILDRFMTREGVPMIDYVEPQRSALLQMALPRNDARTPHPPVEGWRPVFRTRDNRRFLQAIEWIRSMYRPRPEYPIEYPPRSADAPPDAPLPPPPDEEPVER